MNEDMEREDFESYARFFGMVLERLADGYENDYVNFAWVCWKSAIFRATEPVKTEMAELQRKAEFWKESHDLAQQYWSKDKDELAKLRAVISSAINAYRKPILGEDK